MRFFHDSTGVDETQDLLNTKQAATFLGVSRKTVQRYRRDGILMPNVLGEEGTALYSKAQLIEAARRLGNVESGFESRTDAMDTDNNQEGIRKLSKRVRTNLKISQSGQKTGIYHKGTDKPQEKVQKLSKRVRTNLKRGQKLSKRVRTNLKISQRLSVRPVPMSANNSLNDAVEQSMSESEKKSNTSITQCYTYEYPKYGNEQTSKSSDVKNLNPEQMSEYSNAIIPVSTPSKLVYVDKESEKLAKEATFITPVTLYIPKDKVSNKLWSNELPCNTDKGIITVFKSEDFGCIVRLNYDKIFEDEHIITKANFSAFDRSVHDAIVTIMVAGNNIFSNTMIWRVITQNPKARITDTERIKIVKSMFHISNFLLSIINDYSERVNTWAKFNSDPKGHPFKSERKFYTKIKSIYGGRLLEFRWLAERPVMTITRTVDGQEIAENKYLPEVWQFLAAPILYQYAADKEQVAAVAMELLNISNKADQKPVIKRGTHTDELTNFLAREINTMKKNSVYNKTILLDRLYSIDGINDVQQDKNNLKKKKKRTRDKIDKILSRFKENGMIQRHTFNKKVTGRATTFYSVEIHL